MSNASRQTIYLHIGFHKTGSSAIQSSFNGYADTAFCYAKLGYENHSIPIYTIFSGHHQSYHIWKSAGMTAPEIEAHRDKLAATTIQFFRQEQRRDVILSGEDISVMSQEALQHFHAVLNQNTPRIVVIAYVRDPVSFISSELQERIKYGGMGHAPVPPGYRAKLERVFHVFGREATIIRDYHRSTLKNGDIVEDFADLIGCPVPRRPRDENLSLSTEAVRVIYHLNTLETTIADPRALTQTRARCIAHLRALFPGRFELPRDLISGLVDAADVSWLYENTGIEYRSDEEEHAPVFSPEALDLFLSEVEPRTIEQIRDYLGSTVGISDLPRDLKALISRYFMSFA